MPLYEYQCRNCGNVYTELRKMNDSNLSKCPGCDSGETEKRISMFAGGKAPAGCGHSHSSGGG